MEALGWEGRCAQARLGRGGGPQVGESWTADLSRKLQGSGRVTRLDWEGWFLPMRPDRQSLLGSWGLKDHT